MSTGLVFVESRHDKTRIQVKVTVPESNNSNELPAVILAHPYGPLGGNMRNNVVMALHKYFAGRGYLTASLNFRGCGGSEGRTSWTGMPERGDYEAVVDYLLEQNPRVSHLFLGGYSFGSMIAASILPGGNRPVPCSYLLISYPLRVQWALATWKTSFFSRQVAQLLSNHRVLLVFGDHDQFTGIGSYENWVRQANKDIVQVSRVEGADHFWFGYEDVLVRIVDSWLAWIQS